MWDRRGLMKLNGVCETQKVWRDGSCRKELDGFTV